VALAVLVAVAPSPGQTSDRRERPDIRWLRQWGAWEEDIRPQLIDLGGRESYVNEYPADAKERDELARDLAKLWTCDGFDARVPPAPARFAGGMASSIDFCSSLPLLLAAGRDMVRRIKGSHQAFDAESRASENRLLKARDEIRGVLRAFRPL